MYTLVWCLSYISHTLSYFFMIVIIACVLKVPISHEYIHMYKYCWEFDLACINIYSPELIQYYINLSRVPFLLRHALSFVMHP